MLFRDLKINKLDYSVLAVLASTFIFYYATNLDHPYQLFVATVIFSILYFIWGIWHHLRSNYLTSKIVLEYFLVATLGVIIVSTILI